MGLRFRNNKTKVNNFIVSVYKTGPNTYYAYAYPIIDGRPREDLLVGFVVDLKTRRARITRYPVTMKLAYPDIGWKPLPGIAGRITSNDIRNYVLNRAKELLNKYLGISV